MERDLTTKDRLAGSDLRLEHVSRLFESLEASAIVMACQTVATELIGPSSLRVFTFAPHDPATLLSFGPETEGRRLKAPEVPSDGTILPSTAPIDPAQEPREGASRVLLPLRIGGEAVGIIEVESGRPLDAGAASTLSSLAPIFAMAVRNGLVFENTRRLTFTDDLTALYNSRFMGLYLDRELKRCRRTRSALTLLFMDLDGFKAINDTHGHLAGSRTLVEVGAVLEKTVRDADVLVRYGGDEFVILFPETPLSGGLVIAERIRRVIADTHFLQSHQIDARVSASIGIAAYPENADDARSLIACADQAMYQAKALGKDRVVKASPLSHPSKRP